MTDPRAEAPESGVDSGDPSPSAAGSASRPAPAADGTPEVGPDGLAPLAAPAEEEPEPATAAGPDLDLEALISKAEKADEYLALAQRTQADFENYRKRTAREAAAARERGATKLALELLPAIDNLDRALAHAESGAGGENDGATLLPGIRHVHTDVLAALGRVGIEPYSPEGERFDPQFHEAVAQAPVQGTEPGTVVEVFQCGYRRGESVLRPARVVVAG